MNMLIDNVNINYLVEGEGQNVLILHGWGTNIETMLPIHNILKSKYKVHTVDFPGFGKSDKPLEAWGVYEYAEYIKKFIDLKKMKEVILVGHSFGGRISIILANKYPKLIKKMVLIDTAGIIPKRQLNYYVKVYSFKALRFIYNRLFFWIDKEKRLKKFYEKFGSQDYKDAEDIMRKVLVKVVNEDLEPLLEGIKASTLLVWGRDDEDTPVYMGEIMNEKIEDSGLIILEDAGHYSYIDQYGQFKKILKSFFGI